MSLNVPRISGDFIHLFSFIILIFRICKYKSSAGISAKTQLLLLLVFSTRYYTSPHSVYFELFGSLFICLTCVTMILIYFVYNETYEKKLDTFRIEFLLLGALLGCFLNYKFAANEVLWAFNLYLEAMALWPQFFIINKTKQVSKFVFFYLSALGVYRVLYIVNYFERSYQEDFYGEPICWNSASIQLIPYLIFWVLCINKVVIITKEGNLWYHQNLQENSCQNEIFTITVPNEKEEEDKLPLV